MAAVRKTDLGGQARLSGKHAMDTHPGSGNNMTKIVLAGLSSALFTSVAFGQSFRLSDLGSWSADAYPYDMNDQGDIVGFMKGSFPGDHAFRYSGGSMQDLSTYGITDAVARGINKDGTVVGYAASSSLRGFILTDQGVEWLDSEDREYIPEAINDAGAVVGSLRLRDSSVEHSFIYMDGQTQTISIGGYSRPWDINESGQFVGDSDGRPFFYDGSTVTFLGSASIHQGAAYAVNDLGQTVGYWLDSRSGNFRAFLYSDGTFSDIGSFSSNYAVARDINNAGWVIGESSYISKGQRAFLYKDSQMLDLNGMVDDTGTGYTLTYALAVNNQNQITAMGTLPSGEWRIVLLTPNAPVPEPGVLVGLATGAILLIRRVRSN
ncbi:DUF3466 family protein [bacterium]|nr:MAG: DUF3466 family protein [bacterium]